MILFDKENTISSNFFNKITNIRVKNPRFVLSAAQKRKQRKEFAPSGKLNIVAADHPARGSLNVADQPLMMGDRHELLARLVYILQSDWIDGVLGSMDLLEELIILHELMSKRNGGFLDEKLLIVSLNRGGHPGTAWELNDPITGTCADMCKQMKIDASKMLLRIDPTSKETLRTLMACVEGVNQMSEAQLPIFLEPLPVEKKNGCYRVINDTKLLVEAISITAALGNMSQYIWLKLPFINNFSRVTAATTLPIVMLGGGRCADLKKLLSNLDQAIRAGRQVRGAMFGRNLLYPQSVDSFELAEAIGRLIHGDSTPDNLVKKLESE